MNLETARRVEEASDRAGRMPLLRVVRAAGLLIAGMALIALAGRMHPRLLEFRRGAEPGLIRELDHASPLLAFTTVALGGFRGVLCDILWLRVGALQEEGQFFEIVQLADWITTLEPQFAAVWGYHAWNLAYNISVLFPDPRDRWRWVRHGIHLLRDEGLAYNPDSARLYWELGWLFEHKLGAPYDQAHRYYQFQWAAEMSRLLPGGRAAYARLTPGAPAAETLRRDFKLDPAIMQKVDDAYGPLDWRIPETHALYWACCGLPFAEGFDRESLNRMVVQSLHALLQNGSLRFDETEGVYDRAPDLALLPRALAAAEQARRDHPDKESFAAGYLNLMRDAVALLAAADRRGEAARLLAHLQSQFPDADRGLDLDAFLASSLRTPPAAIR